MDVESEEINRKNTKKKKKIHPNTNGRVRVSKACLNCRARHQRCGFERPCKHCKEAGVECRDSNYSQTKPSKIFPAIQKIQKPNLLPPFQNGTVLFKQFNSMKKNQVQLPKILNINQNLPSSVSDDGIIINISDNDTISRYNERMNIKSSLLNKNENNEISPKSDKVVTEENIKIQSQPTFNELTIPKNNLKSSINQTMEFIITPETPQLEQNCQNTLSIDDTISSKTSSDENSIDNEQSVDSTKFSVLSNIVDNLPNNLPMSDISTGITQLPNAPIVENFSQDLNNSTQIAPQPLDHMPEPLLLQTDFDSSSSPEQENLNDPINDKNLNSEDCISGTKENEVSQSNEDKISDSFYTNFHSDSKLSPTQTTEVGESFDKLFESVEKSKIM